MVIRFSKVRVMTGPTLTRRSFLVAMTVTAEGLALALVGALVGDVVESEGSGRHLSTPRRRAVAVLPPPTSTR